MFIIRQAILEDSDAINVVSGHLGYSALSTRDAKAKLQMLLESESDFVFIAENGNEIIGWLHVFRAHRLASSDFFEIGGLVVKPGHRGQGAGRALVDYVTEHTQGKLRVRCNTMRVESHQFYKALGFYDKKSQLVFEKKVQ